MFTLIFMAICLAITSFLMGASIVMFFRSKEPIWMSLFIYYTVWVIFYILRIGGVC